MTPSSLDTKAAKARDLLDEFLLRLEAQSASDQEHAAAELDRFSAFLDKYVHQEMIQDQNGDIEAPGTIPARELQAIIDAIPSPIFIARDAIGQSVIGNHTAYQMLQAKPGSNLSRLASATYPEGIQSESHAGAEIVPAESPINVALRTGKPTEEYEAQIRFEDGREITLLGSANPLKDAEGNVTGAVSVYVDITARTEAERALRVNAERDAYRISLADALRRLTDPEQIKSTAAEILGKKLGASRVFYGSIVADGAEIILEPGYADGVAPLTGRFRFSDFSRDLKKDHPNGKPYVISDTFNDPRLNEDQKAAYKGVGVGAHVDVPLLLDGKFVALLSVEQTCPHLWTNEELALIVETAERTWASVERARAEKALTESEARFRESIGSLMESFILYSAVRETRKDGKPGKIRDLRYVYANPAAHRVNDWPEDNWRDPPCCRYIPITSERNSSAAIRR